MCLYVHIMCTYGIPQRSLKVSENYQKKYSTFSLPKNIQISEALHSRIALSTSSHCINGTITQHPNPQQHRWMVLMDGITEMKLVSKPNSPPCLEALFSISRLLSFSIYLSLSLLHTFPKHLPISSSPRCHCAPNLSSSQIAEELIGYLGNQNYQSPSSSGHVYNGQNNVSPPTTQQLGKILTWCGKEMLQLLLTFNFLSPIFNFWFCVCFIKDITYQIVYTYTHVQNKHIGHLCSSQIWLHNKPLQNLVTAILLRSQILRVRNLDRVQQDACLSQLHNFWGLVGKTQMAGR